MEHKLRTPLTEDDVRALRVGDIVYLDGLVITARDAAHRRIVEHMREGRPLPIDLRGGVLYHCGPLVRRVGDSWEVLAAGPTTSVRMEPYEAEVISRLGVRMIVGKGGMGTRTAEACRRHGAVYAMFTGGAAVLAARYIKRVVTVEWLDLGLPEALWVLEVGGFGPLIVTIDSSGRNLTEEVMEAAKAKRERILRKLGAL